MKRETAIYSAHRFMLMQIAIHDNSQTRVKGIVCGWEHCVKKTYIENVTVSPYYHTIITYVCLDVCT